MRSPSRARCARDPQRILIAGALPLGWVVFTSEPSCTSDTRAIVGDGKWVQAPIGRFAPVLVQYHPGVVL